MQQRDGARAIVDAKLQGVGDVLDEPAHRDGMRDVRRAMTARLALVRFLRERERALERNRALRSHHALIASHT